MTTTESSVLLSESPTVKKIRRLGFTPTIGELVDFAGHVQQAGSDRTFPVYVKLAKGNMQEWLESRLDQDDNRMLSDYGAGHEEVADWIDMKHLLDPREGHYHECFMHAEVEEFQELIHCGTPGCDWECDECQGNEENSYYYYVIDLSASVPEYDDTGAAVEDAAGLL